MLDFNTIKNLIDPQKETDKQFFVDLADTDKQFDYENNRLRAVLAMLKILYINKLKKKIEQNKDRIAHLNAKKDFEAKDYCEIQGLYAQIQSLEHKIDGYKCFFNETYFARMDVEDDKEGYNSYYIGKHGDEGLEIIDWRAPFARRYYQKTNVKFSINQFNYKLVLRRALRTHFGKVEDMRNEYLSLKDYLPQEELAGKEEEVNFDPFLKDILKSRKEKEEITDIIETIQEKQYEIITAPEDKEFYVQGVAGSGKTMILLHRLSYLLYNFENIKASDVLIITPSNSFNDFIDELATVLELGRVKTMTLDSYYDSMLASADVSLKNKIDTAILPNQDYLNYIYSSRFVADVDKKLAKIRDGIYGLFAPEVCGEFVSEMVQGFVVQQANYEKIKNASIRVRRCVLGEIKEKPDGGLYYTKRFRELFNAIYTVKEFLVETLNDERISSCAYFYVQLSAFYRSIRFIRIYGEKICADALDDLSSLARTLEREITDLKRYKTNDGTRQVLTYAGNISKKEELIKEITSIEQCVVAIGERMPISYDFTEVLKGDRNLVEIGKSTDKRELLRHFFKEIIKPIKRKYGVLTQKLCSQDKYCLCLLLLRLGFNLTPKHAYVFVDEAQDLSKVEYDLLREVNGKAKFNLFGDLKQNVTEYRGIKEWQTLNLDGYDLNLNYRNTNQIVEFVSGKLNIDMKPIGLDGDEVKYIKEREINAFFSDKNGLKAIITSDANKSKFSKKTYNVISQTGKISKTKINLMTVYESKGLEFTAVAVASEDMTDNEKYVAYTRALNSLAIIK